MKYRLLSRRIPWFALLVALAIALPSVLFPGFSRLALAQSTSEDVQFNAVLQTGPIYPKGRMIPLQLRITNRTSRDIDGTVEIKDLPTPAGTIDVSRPARSAANSRTTLDLLLQLPEPPPRDKNGMTKPSTEIIFWNAAHARQGNPEKVMALPDEWEGTQGREATGIPGVILLYSIRTPEIDDGQSAASEIDPNDAGDLAVALSGVLPFTVTPASIEPSDMFRRVEAYDACRLIAIDAFAIEQLDAAQRAALLQHVRSGATLIVPDPSQALQSTWLAELLPMDVLNVRQSTAIDTREFGRLPMRGPQPEYECELRTGTSEAGKVVAVATNDRGAVAAYREVGLGRIAMVGCAINALAAQEPAVVKMWTALLNPERPAFHDPEALAESPPLRKQLPSMIGATAPPWRTAAIIVVAYVALVAVVLAFSGARWRPMAFGLSALIAVLVAGGVVALAGYKTSNVPLMAASVSVVDLNGNVARSDSLVTFFGDRNDLTITAQPGTVITPVVVSSVAGSDSGPRATMFPLQLDGLSASLGKLNTVVRAQSTSTTSSAPVSATLNFDPQGASVKLTGVDSLESPRLVSGGGIVFPLQPGADARRVAPRNAIGVWGDIGGMIASEQSKLRDELVRSSEELEKTPGSRPAAGRSGILKVIGFIDSAALGNVSGVQMPPVDVEKNATLVRIPVTIAPAAAGSEVKVDAGFVQYRREPLPTNVPFSPDTGAWNESSQSGSWLIALSAPDALGKLQPKTLSLDADLRGVGYDIAIRRGQLNGEGKARPNEAGEAVLEWINSSGPKHTTVELSPSDVDANGWVWLLVTVRNTQSAGALAMDAPLPWQVARFDPAIAGTVTGPPQTPRVTWEIEEAPKPAPPKKAPEKKPEPKKTDEKKAPATKPAAAKPDPKKTDEKK